LPSAELAETPQEAEDLKALLPLRYSVRIMKFFTISLG
jgi:hypothetical protein